METLINGRTLALVEGDITEQDTESTGTHRRTERSSMSSALKRCVAGRRTPSRGLTLGRGSSTTQCRCVAATRINLAPTACACVRW